MSRIELIYDRDCPNVERARANLREALQTGRQPLRWTEWERADAGAPGYVRGFGSPTVLVDGRDVAGDRGEGDVSCCRLYHDERGTMVGAPPTERILAALQGTKTTEQTAETADAPDASGGRQRDSAERSGRWLSLAALPGIGAAALPVGFCPACWPAYAAVLGTLGLGPLLYAPYLAPVIGVLLVLAVAGLAWRARRRRGYGPAVLGGVAAGVIVVGKFVLQSDPAGMLGMGLLLAATIWNAWPRRVAGTKRDACPACAPRGEASVHAMRGAKECSS